MWTKEEEEFIRLHITKTPYRMLTEMLNKAFDTEKTIDCVKKFCNRKHISNYVNRWSEREKEWLKEHINDGLSFRELADGVSSLNGIQRTMVDTRNQCYFLGLHNKRDTKFQKGHEAEGNVLKIGDELRQGGNKNVYVKVSNEARGSLDNRTGYLKNYRLKHELLWEETTGHKLPDGWIVVFVDGNRQNYSPDNLMAIPNRAKCEMNKRGWQFEDEPELRRTALLHCKLNAILKKDGEMKWTKD